MHDQCRRLVELLHDFVSGELPPEDLSTLQAHVAACPPCEVYVSTYRLTITVTRTLPQPSVPPEVADRILKALRRECGSQD